MKLTSKIFLTCLAAFAIASCNKEISPNATNNHGSQESATTASPSTDTQADNSLPTDVKEHLVVDNTQLTEEDIKNLALMQASSLDKLLKLSPEQLKVVANTLAETLANPSSAKKLTAEENKALQDKLRDRVIEIDTLTRMEADKAALEAFQKANKDVKVDKNGLVYLIKNPGKGPQVKDTDSINTTYTLTFADNKEIDKGTYDLDLGNLPFPGLQACYTKVKVGGEITCYIPYQLAAGELGNQVVPPKAMLVIDAKVNKINPTDKSAAPTEKKDSKK